MQPYVAARYVSITLSPSAAAVEILLARSSVTIPLLKAATIARMPMFSITIAIRSSIRPKPCSERSRTRTRGLSATPGRPSSGAITLPIRRGYGGVHLLCDQRRRAPARRRGPRARRRGRAGAAPSPWPPAGVSDGAPGERRRGRPHRLQEDQAEDAADLLAPVRDHDRGRPERRQLARDPRRADRRSVLRPRDQGDPRRRRGWAAAVASTRPPPEDLQPPLRRDGRGRRGRRNPRHGARPRRLPDREGDADQAPRQGRDDVPDDGADLRHPRPDGPADVPRARIREDLRAAERRPADPHAVGGRRLGPAPHPLLH